MSHRHLPLHCLYRKFRVSATQATTLSVSVRQWMCITSSQWREPPLNCREYYFFAIEHSTHAQAFLSETEPIRLVGPCCQDIAVLGQFELKSLICALKNSPGVVKKMSSNSHKRALATIVSKLGENTCSGYPKKCFQRILEETVVGCLCSKPRAEI